jgi:hypothetical protein
VQAIVTILLLAVLAAAIVFFAVMGVAQRRRTRALARRAHAAGMQFAGDDPFDVPRRYADLALVTCGHSPRAHNVTYGRLEGLPVRAFDFRYEVAHGTRRVTRHYGVVVAEAGRELPDLLMWHDDDEAVGAMLSRETSRRVGQWACVGHSDLALRLSARCPALTHGRMSLQTKGGKLMLCARGRARGRRYAVALDDAADVLRAVVHDPPAGEADPRESAR